MKNSETFCFFGGQNRLKTSSLENLYSVVFISMKDLINIYSFSKEISKFLVNKGRILIIENRNTCISSFSLAIFSSGQGSLSLVDDFVALEE